MLRLRAAMADMKVWTTKPVRSSLQTEKKPRSRSFYTNRGRGFLLYGEHVRHLERENLFHRRKTSER